jgi:uncharacterized membrane protein YtjA (UPF0391 family)
LSRAAGRAAKTRGIQGKARRGLYQPAPPLAPRGTKFLTPCYRISYLEDKRMSILKWALIFLVVSIVAGLLGFTGVSAASADIARVLFYIFVVIFLVLLILGLTIFRA